MHMMSLTCVTYHLNNLIRLQISHPVVALATVCGWWQPLGASVDKCLGGKCHEGRHPEDPEYSWLPIRKPRCSYLRSGTRNIIKTISMILQRGILGISGLVLNITNRGKSRRRNNNILSKFPTFSISFCHVTF